MNLKKSVFTAIAVIMMVSTCSANAFECNPGRAAIRVGDYIVNFTAGTVVFAGSYCVLNTTDLVVAYPGTCLNLKAQYVIPARSNEVQRFLMECQTAPNSLRFGDIQFQGTVDGLPVIIRNDTTQGITFLSTGNAKSMLATDASLPTMTPLSPEQRDLVRFLEARNWKPGEDEVRRFIDASAKERTKLLRELE